ncbi:MAG TPA: hypothetical protein VN923_11080, partial [Thermoanaerobaculia bacterium]|nr:hypothetical protein [Thermoanaerobaculia bacterium]
MPHSRRIAVLAVVLLAALTPLFGAATPAFPPERPPEAAALPTEGAGRPPAAEEEKPKPLSAEELAKGPL